MSRVARYRMVVLAAVAAMLMVALASGAHADILVSVDKSAQRMTVTVDGVRRYVWPVSTGRTDYATPTGEFTPFRMEIDHKSEEWDDAPMPYSIFFTRTGVAIHGTNETRHLGLPVSHGCVRLSAKNAATLWALVKAQGMKNTRVVVRGSETIVASPATPRQTMPQSILPSAQTNMQPPDGDITGSIAPRTEQLDTFATRMGRRYRAERQWQDPDDVYADQRRNEYPPFSPGW